MASDYFHIPVLLEESLEWLAVKQGGTYVDATIGFGGHSKEILKRLKGKGLLVGIDNDTEVIKLANDNLENCGSSYKIIQGNFRNIKNILNEIGVNSVDGILFDIGVSNLELSDISRGFSFNLEGPLDMRMDKVNNHITADDIVNTYPQEKLLKIFYKYGEERWSKKIVEKIINERAKKRIETTVELAELIKNAIPKKYWPPKIHPATRIFQALRIEVNDELNNLKEGVGSAFRLLESGGRIVVISFNSLEDRIVKHSFLDNKENLKILTKKPITPGPDEIEKNIRSRSAKLRAAEKK